MDTPMSAEKVVAMVCINLMCVQCFKTIMSEPAQANAAFEAFVTLCNAVFKKHFPELLESMTASDVAESLLKKTDWNN